MKKYGITIVLFFFSSCLDMILDDKRILLENFYLMHVDASGITGYSLFFKIGTDIYKPVVEENVLQIWGDSTVFYVQSQEGMDTNFYRIYHLNGDSIVSINGIKKEEFEQRLIYFRIIYDCKQKATRRK